MKRLPVVIVMAAMSVIVGSSSTFFGGNVFAEDRPTVTGEKTTEATQEAREHALKLERAAAERQAAKEKAAETRRLATKERLSEAKLKACNERRDKIADHVADISERATKHLATFDSISDRVQAFYTRKGNELANYDALVSNVAIKRASAETAVNDLNARKDSFSCEGIDPKSTITTYKTALETTRAALKEYRTAIKDLIVGVKSVNASTTSNATKSNRESE